MAKKKSNKSLLGGTSKIQQKLAWSAIGEYGDTENHRGSVPLACKDGNTHALITNCIISSIQVNFKFL
jgi:hypothetical protein